MVQVCQGTSTKNDMLHLSIDQYKEMFILVRREFEKVTTVSGILLLFGYEFRLFIFCFSLFRA